MIISRVKIFFLTVFVFNCSLSVLAQQASIYGTVKDTTGQPLQLVFIGIEGLPGLPTFTDSLGRYKYDVPTDKEVEVIFSHTGFISHGVKVNLKNGESKEVNVSLRMLGSIDTVTITAMRHSAVESIQLNPEVIRFIPTPSGDFNSIVMSQPGVFSRTELGSEYSVRGGSYDENLVYVNGIEVYRPLLVREGEQEGLSFVNPDLVSNVTFSAGGFEAKYGDKLSSVLDVTYKKPKRFEASASASLLGGSLHMEDASKNDRFTWIFGVRYKSNQYLFKGLDVQGDYKPKFADAQLYMTYALSDNWEVDVLGNFSLNQYNFIPQSETASFGTVSLAYQLQVYFQGQELDEFQTGTGAVSFVYNKNIYRNEVKHKFNMSFTGSIYNDAESQNYDIIGQYLISELNSNVGSSSLGQATYGVGVGAYVNHARDDIGDNVYSFQHAGSYDYSSTSKVIWGATYQHERILTQTSQWNLNDSAGYNLPYSPYILQLQNVAKAYDTLESNRLMGFIENVSRWRTFDTSSITLTAGVRANYWDINQEMVVSPRATLAFKPNWHHDILFRVSSGLYYQPPAYKEMLEPDGSLLTSTKDQESIHFVAGMDWNFKAWNAPFKWITEAYYKDLVTVEPYEINNVSVDYFPGQTAKGHIQGLDMKINGDFVKGLESWFSVSVMQASYQINNAYYYDYYNSYGQQIVPGVTANTAVADSVKHGVGALPMPTDERVTVGIFFQDYLPHYPNLKVNLNILFGTGLPFGPPASNSYGDTLRTSFYKRVDLGASYLVIGKRGQLKTGISKYFKSLWIGLEVFNLLQVNNVISYNWIQDVNGREYAIPNYLTAREVNVKVMVDF
ncbi:MAG TPA: carboxypeptidase-like regulatory domain-containing protein [Bacteroidia bacterium]|nr:carboxypeptidase-like regulatory domain-containing protein [Bacteroidia bacterium]